MTALWMLFALFISTLFTGWAALAERLSVQRERSARWSWAVAMAGSIVVPLGSIWWHRPGSSSVHAIGEHVIGARPDVGTTIFMVPTATGWLAELDVWLIGGWAVCSLLALGAICRSALALRSQRRWWASGSVGGVPVSISRATGPAAAGILRPEIVVPAWVLSANEEDQRLLVEHELEHHRAGDPLLLLASRIGLALMPWNLPLRFQLHRLRAAVEIDCDARVLRESGRSSRRYGILLIETARLTGRASEVLAFAAPTVLERRLRVLTGERPKLSGRTRMGALVLVLSAPVLLTIIPAPPPPSAELLRVAVAVWLDSRGAQPIHAIENSGRVELMNRHEAPAILRRRYPATLREAGIGGTVIIDAFVDETGRVGEMRINESSGQRDLDRAGLDVMQDLRFAPARAAGRPVSTWVQHPVTFLPDQVEGSSGPPVRIAIWASGG
ncbi:MAG: TonB family protein [Gemmatimonadetes bacterium]|nr:TonB family protein [Gemmatimonadota bacterium]